MRSCSKCGGKYYAKGLCRKCYGNTPERRLYNKFYQRVYMRNRYREKEWQIVLSQKTIQAWIKKRLNPVERINFINFVFKDEIEKLKALGAMR